jgi:membrane associated rhomboid family serine protease
MGFPGRNFAPPTLPSAGQGVKMLLVVNSALFLLGFVLARGGGYGFLEPFMLVPREVLTGFALWQPFTYLFLHDPGGFSHILFNMLALYLFGSTLEGVWGTRRFLRYYFICGIGAGLCVIAANLFFGGLDTRTIGASGAIYGLLIAFGVLFPEATILFMFIFPMKAKYFVAIIGAIAFLSSMSASTGAGSGVSHFAHLGGFVVGWFALRSRFMAGAGSGARSRPRPRGPGLAETLRQQYKDWKLRRAKKKFQVYLRKHGGGNPPDRWVN